MPARAPLLPAPIALPSLKDIAFALSLVLIATLPCERALTIGGIGSVSRVLGAVLAGLWLLNVFVTERIRKLSPYHIAVFAFIGWCTGSTLWSIDPGATMSMTVTLIQMAGLTLMVWDLYRTHESIRAALQAYVIGAVAPIVATIHNYLIGNAHVWGRYTAFGDNANTTGIFIAFSVPMAWHLAVSPSRSRIKHILQPLNIVQIFFAIFAIALTATRFAMLMLVPAVILVLLSLRRFRFLVRATILTIIVVGVGVAGLLIPKSSIERLATLEDEMAYGDMNGRAAIWKAGLAVWAEHPAAGIGAGAYPAAVATAMGRPRDAHNSFVALVTEVGVIGIFLVATMIMLAIREALRHPKYERYFWIVFLVVLGFGNMPMTFYHTKFTWLLLALCVASARIRRDVRPTPGFRSAPGAS